MNAFDAWLLKRIARKEVTQGYYHAERITAMYRIINQAARKEFYEDNEETLSQYLTEWFNDSLDSTSHRIVRVTAEKPKE
jgi:hypothetical protein